MNVLSRARNSAQCPAKIPVSRSRCRGPAVPGPGRSRRNGGVTRKTGQDYRDGNSVLAARRKRRFVLAPKNHRSVSDKGGWRRQGERGLREGRREWKAPQGRNSTKATTASATEPGRKSLGANVVLNFDRKTAVDSTLWVGGASVLNVCQIGYARINLRVKLRGISRSPDPPRVFSGPDRKSVV